MSVRIWVEHYILMEQDSMIGLLVIGVFQAVLLVLLLLTKRNKSIADYILAGYLVLSGLLIFFTYLEIWNRNNDFQYLWLANLRTPFILLIGPVLWLYVKLVTEQHFRFKLKYLLTLIPFLLVSMLATRDYFRPDLAITAAPNPESLNNQFNFFFIIGLIAISNIGYTAWGLALIGRYKKALKTYFSSTEKINLYWLQFILISALIAYSGISGLYIANAVFNLMGCANQQAIQDDKKWSPIYRIQAGTIKGGIVENTEMTLMDNSGADAFTGARLGLFVDVYLGARAYEDFYNRIDF